MSELSHLENRACETIQNQTDGQLLYTVSQLENEPEFGYVDYMLVSEAQIAFPVKRDFFIWTTYNELYFRGLAK